MFRRSTLLLLPALAGCGTQTPSPRHIPIAPMVSQRPVPPPPVVVPVVRPKVEPGPPQVIGRDARALIANFGQPRLDIRESTVRKLQFAGGSCIMDTYLYAPENGKEPVATHVDARLPNGADTDPGKCAESLAKK